VFTPQFVETMRTTMPTTPNSSSSDEGSSVWLALAAAARTEATEVPTAIVRDYRPELSTPALIAEVRRLLFSERRAGRLVCRYLADLADRIHARRDGELMAYVDELHATACFFDLGARETRERVRIGRALRGLPQVEAAFIAGEVSYSRVREITRVARPETESAWLELARSLDMRSLERRVTRAAEAPGGDARPLELGVRKPPDEGAAAFPSAAPEALDALPTPDALHLGAGEPAATPTEDGVTLGRATVKANARSFRTEWIERHDVRLIFELSADTWALLERALQGARHRAGTPLSDAEALEAVARDALALQRGADEASGSRGASALDEGQHCGKAELDIGAPPIGLERAAIETHTCGSGELQLQAERRTVESGKTHRPALNHSLLPSARFRCRMPGCRCGRHVDRHYVAADAEGYGHSRPIDGGPRATRHAILREGGPRVADGALTVEDASGDLSADRKAPRHPPACRQAGSFSKPVARGSANTGAAAFGATLDGTPDDVPLRGETMPHVGTSNDHAIRLLRIVGRRSRWTPGELGDESGLSLPELQHALLLLELDGYIRRPSGFVTPV
jgi:hypothetical protein